MALTFRRSLCSLPIPSRGRPLLSPSNMTQALHTGLLDIYPHLSHTPGSNTHTSLLKHTFLQIISVIKLTLNRKEWMYQLL